MYYTTANSWVRHHQQQKAAMKQVIHTDTFELWNGQNLAQARIKVSSFLSLLYTNTQEVLNPFYTYLNNTISL